LGTELTEQGWEGRREEVGRFRPNISVKGGFTNLHREKTKKRKGLAKGRLDPWPRKKERGASWEKRVGKKPGKSWRNLVKYDAQEGTSSHDVRLKHSAPAKKSG